MALATYYEVSVDWLSTKEGDQSNVGAAVAQNEDEAVLLWAYRSLPTKEAKAHLNLMLSRLKPASN